MHWRTKSLIQRICAALPASDTSYYYLQRRFGSLRTPPPPADLLRTAASFGTWLKAQGLGIRGKVGLEVGTGRRIDIPLGLFLLGAKETHTYDISRYLRPELVEFSLACIRERREEYESLLQSASEDPDELKHRYDKLVAATNATDAMKVANVTYHAPANAAKTALPEGSVDVHYSNTVFEHIPREILGAILAEARRVMAPGAVALHHIDVSDHFSHDDPSICAINFLRLSASEWKKLGANKFAYHNRLQAHHHEEIFRAAGFELLKIQKWTDERVLSELYRGFPLAPEFRKYPVEELAVTVTRILARPA